VLDLLKNGHAVLGLDRDSHGLKRLEDEARDKSLQITAVDLSNFDEEALAKNVDAQFGPVDILINNAGIGQAQIRSDYHTNMPRFYEVSAEQWRLAFDINATAVFLLSRAFAPGMVDRGWGRIINITTSLGTMLRSGYVPYGPSKASAEALSAAMATDLEGAGVTVNVITPGAVLNSALIPNEAPFVRDALAQPEVMLPPMRWLCSNASDGVSGQRYLGIKWNPELEPERAAQQAGAPIGWKSLATLPEIPSQR